MNGKKRYRIQTTSPSESYRFSECASIKLDQVYNEEMNEEKIRSIRKAFNVERQALEATELQKVIPENSTLEYLQDKKYLRDRWTIISKANA